MAGTESLTLTAEIDNGFIATEVEMDSNFWELKNKRMRKVHAGSGRRAGGSLDLAAPLKIFRDDLESANAAEVFLLPEELPTFTLALIQHPILLPTSFSQHLSMERGINIIRLTSREPFEDFAERLSAALHILG